MDGYLLMCTACEIPPVLIDEYQSCVNPFLERSRVAANGCEQLFMEHLGAVETSMKRRCRHSRSTRAPRS